MLRKLWDGRNQRQWWLNPAYVKYVEAEISPASGLTIYFVGGEQGEPDIRVVADTPENRLALELEK